MAGHAYYREDHPLVFVVQHYINLICMVVLAFTGFYIHYPFFEGFMGVARLLHFIAMFAIVANLTLRILFSFFVKSANIPGSREVAADIKNWLPQEANRHQLLQQVKYYLFMRKKAIISGKYGPLQKITYLSLIPLTYFQAYTGFALYGPTMDWPFFAAGIDAFGGPMNVRIIHYFVMWAFILFTMIHVYLANVYGMAPSKLMFAWKESRDGR